MTVAELFARAMDAKVGDKLAVYQVGIDKIAKNQKSGLSTITLTIRTAEFNPNDALAGIAVWVLMGRADKLRALARDDGTGEGARG